MDSRATEREILELENKLLRPTAEPISLPLYFLRLITGDFCDEQELGRGGYGVVYEGRLLCGLIVAVKKFPDIVVDDQFQKEATFLMGIQHPNVVRILGYCAESRWENMEVEKGKGRYVFAEIRARMLCFEYMCNKGLDEYLSDEYSGLEWNKRYQIIKGICRGLDFLHKYNIVHLDLKPQNILMDANMMPKIADFGLSRFLGEQKSNIVTVNRAGSRGYMAPEYIDKGVISKKADIFSLGVIIIEILKGRKDDYPDYRRSTKTDFQHFTEKMLGNWRNRFERALNYTALELHIQQVKLCINVALQCVHPDKEERPNTSKIIEIINTEEGSCCVQNVEDLLVDHQMETHDAQHEHRLVALNRSVMKDYTPERTIEDMWNKEISASRAVDMVKSVVALPQPQREPVLACAQRNDGSLATLRYQGARNASFWVAHKALASLEGNLLKGWAAKINLGPNVKALQLELLSAKVILESTLGKVIHNSALECYLMMLQDLVYDAEDVLDEMEYFRIQDNADYQNADEPPELRFDRDDAFRRIQHIVEQMRFMRQEVSSAIKPLGSDWSTAPNIAQSRPITISESIEPKLYGRELMMKSIIDDITKGKHSHAVLTVIPIVGPGGIGKTTLAQHIYHSGEVLEHFDVRVWTCVSLNFNVNKLIDEIQRYIPKVDHESSNGTASELIGQRLKNKRLLLVLDDIWDCSDEDEWKRLLVPFRKSQVQGNIIIVTTRFPAQAHIMVRKNNHSIYLQGLDSKEFEELFLEIIFGDDDQSRKDHKFLLETGFLISGRLKGSPLAAKTVGRLLKTQLDLVHWTRVLESKEWEQSNGKNDIMPALKLSFDYLPSRLQQCFSYFALFPQDYKFKKEELINFWIGQEVLHSSHGDNKRVEDIGLNHLTGLVNYGFLEKKGGKDEKTSYIIHDLLHELARKVSSLECLIIDNYQSQVSSLKVLPSIRHLSINIDDTSAKDRLTLKNCIEDFNTLNTRLNVEKLQTLMIFGDHHGCFVKAFRDLFREAKALRVILLSKASYDMGYLLCNFYILRHLRYLRIEGCLRYQVRFSNKISRFYHLKVLDAEHCGSIINLPRDMGNLIKLRHFLVGNDATHSSIFEVGRLKSLQELQRFVVKQEDQGFELRQIGHLVELCGSLSIENLENVGVKEEADEAKLSQKIRLRELTLHWDNIDRFTNDSTLEQCVLERLKPSSNLLELSIKGHGGGTCPSWLGTNLSIKSLETLCLDGVHWKTFPPIGEVWLVNEPHGEIISGNILDKMFKNLRRLELRKLTMVEKWVVHAPCQLFPFLEVFIIIDCPRLVELSIRHFACCHQGEGLNANLFPRLLKLDISNCPRLLSFPPIPWTDSLRSVRIAGIGSLGLCELVCERYFDSQYCLTINGDNDTTDSTFWNVLAFHNLTGLKELVLFRCQSLPLCYLQMLTSLRTLRMYYPSNAFPFVEADRHIKYQFSVESLNIDYWSTSGKELTRLLTYFPELLCLELQHCGMVTGVGVNVRGQQAMTETPRSSSSSSSDNKLGPRAEDEIVASEEAAECGMLLLPPQLQELEIGYCSELRLRFNPHDDNNNEDGRTGGGGGGLQGLISLQQMEIRDCPNLLTSCPSSSFSSFPFPSSLEHLRVLGVVGTKALVPLSNLTSLTSLSISGCGDLKGEGLLSLLVQGHLTKLSIERTPNFFVDSEPSQSHVGEKDLPSRSSKLQELRIDDVAGFTAMPIRHNLLFSSLTTLEISGDEKVQRFTGEQEALLFVNSLEKIIFQCCYNLQYLPAQLHTLPNLKTLQIEECEAMQILPGDALPNSLQELEIYGCPKIRTLPKVCIPSSLRIVGIKNCQSIQMLPGNALPSSLQALRIDDCPGIRSLPKDCLPSSLQELRIISCPAIQSLPEVDDLPGSLRELDVCGSRSEELKRQCRRLIGIIPVIQA